MAVTLLPDLYLYTRDGCHLCDEARGVLQSLLEDRAARGQRTAHVHERDITTNPDWERRSFEVIPVIELGDQRLNLATSPAKVRRFLAEALEGTLA